MKIKKESYNKNKTNEHKKKKYERIGNYHFNTR